MSIATWPAVMAGVGEGGVGITHRITVSTATSALDTAMVTSIAPAQPTFARAGQSGTIHQRGANPAG